MRIVPFDFPRLSTRVVVPFALVVVILLGLLAVTVPGYFEAGTADAYVDAHIEQISPHVPAYVRTLYVNDNTYVHRGDLLVELDPRDYEAQLAIARANVAAASSRLEDARNRVAVVRAAVREVQSRVEVSEAHVRLAQISLRRLLAVTDARAVSTQSIDDATAALAAAQADLLASRSVVQEQTAQEALARSEVETTAVGVDQARASEAREALLLSYTRITSDCDCRVTNKTAQRGDYVQPGQVLFSLVPNAPYVLANYRETELAPLRVGQPALVRVDALGGRKLHGHVDSFQSGTGSRFALLPPQNATGNFIKVVQRVPVKIVLDELPRSGALLAPGMSVETEVFFAGRPHWLGLFE